MTNAELFNQYNTEQWLIEQNLCFMMQAYWEQLKEKGYVNCSQMLINPVGFIKSFMKEGESEKLG